MANTINNNDKIQRISTEPMTKIIYGKCIWIDDVVPFWRGSQMTPKFCGLSAVPLSSYQVSFHPHPLTEHLKDKLLYLQLMRMLTSSDRFMFDMTTSNNVTLADVMRPVRACGTGSAWSSSSEKRIPRLIGVSEIWERYPLRFAYLFRVLILHIYRHDDRE